jgi:hypothetical protein
MGWPNGSMLGLHRLRCIAVCNGVGVMDFWLIGLGVFACGAFYEGSCVMWTHWAERNCALCVGVVSVLQGLCQLTGIGASLADHAYAPFFLVGYFIGPYIVVIAKQKQLMEG